MLRVLLSVIALALLAAGCDENARSSDPEGGREPPRGGVPNLLLILTDDQPPSVGSYPKTKRIFTERGIFYRRGYVTTPLCCPSRASIFSGRYVHNHGVTRNDRAGRFDPELSWQKELSGAGYETALIGKYLNGWDKDDHPPYFDLWERRAPLEPDESLVDRASAFIERQEGDDTRPWAMQLSLHAPHVPWSDVPPEYLETPVGPIPQTPARQERDLSDKAPVVEELQALPRQVREAYEGITRDMRATDDLVKQFWAELEATGEARHTLAIFMSDNGYQVGEHGLIKKTWPYEDSVRVPFMLRWARHVEPGPSDDLVANIDIAPTFYEAARVKPDYEPDGRSLLSGKPREWLYLEGAESNGKYGEWESVIDADTNFIAWLNPDGWQEFYDLNEDPYEIENPLGVGGTADDPDIEPYLERLEIGRNCVGAECP